MSTLRAKQLVKQNLQLYLNDLFLRDGLYTNVTIGDTDFYGNDISRLQPGDQVYPEPDPVSFIANKVWQSAFKNWVYESGVSGPTVVSGVTVNGTFYPTDSGVTGWSSTFAHSVDFPNGRIIFDSPLAGSPTVQTSFAYKTVSVNFANSFNNEKRPLLIETSFKDNPAITGVATYPSVDSVTLPGVFIDVLSRQNSGYELGTNAPIKDFFGVIHIWGRYDFERDLLEDLITDQYRAVLLGIDFNSAPDPLLHNGSPNPAYTTYNEFAALSSPYFWRRIYLEDLSVQKDTPLFNVERSRVDFNIRTYPNF